MRSNAHVWLGCLLISICALDCLFDGLNQSDSLIEIIEQPILQKRQQPNAGLADHAQLLERLDL